MKPKNRWLDRRIAHPGPYLTLCLYEAEYHAAMEHLRIQGPPAWIMGPQADATAHYCTRPDTAPAVVVCLRGWQGRDPVEVAGMLVHEAVHVWQEYAAGIGERNPGSEQEAYAVQAISQELMGEFARRMKEK